MKEADIAQNILSNLDQRPLTGNVNEFLTAEKQGRNPTVRLERGILTRTFQMLHDEMRQTSNQASSLIGRKEFSSSTEQLDLFHNLKAETNHIKHDMDELNRQVTDPTHVTNIEIESEESGRHILPVLELDLQKPKEGEVDTRIPWVGIGGVGSVTEQNFALWMSLALQGERVIVLPYPERNETKPDNWRKLVRKHGKGASLHEQVFIQAVAAYADKIGIKKVNLIGHSVGAEVVIDMAMQAHPAVKINHVIAVEPVGFQGKNLLHNSRDFAFSQAKLTKADQEAWIKMVEQGKENKPPTMFDWLLFAQISGEKVFTPDNLARVQNTGKFQIYVGEQSPVVNVEKIKEITQKIQPDNTTCLPEVFQVEGANHDSLVTHGMGFSRVLLENLQSETPSSDDIHELSINDMESSVAEHILKSIIKTL